MKGLRKYMTLNEHAIKNKFYSLTRITYQNSKYSFKSTKNWLSDINISTSIALVRIE